MQIRSFLSSVVWISNNSRNSRRKPNSLQGLDSKEGNREVNKGGSQHGEASKVAKEARIHGDSRVAKEDKVGDSKDNQVNKVVKVGDSKDRKDRKDSKDSKDSKAARTSGNKSGSLALQR
jgi:hypothetical protein